MNIQKIVIGAGTMRGGIAQVVALVAINDYHGLCHKSSTNTHD